MRSTSSFLLGVAVGIFAVVVVDRTRKMIREEDVEQLRDRISESLRNLEGTVSGLAEGITEGFTSSRD